MKRKFGQLGHFFRLSPLPPLSQASRVAKKARYSVQSGKGWKRDLKKHKDEKIKCHCSSKLLFAKSNDAVEKMRRERLLWGWKWKWWWWWCSAVVLFVSTHTECPLPLWLELVSLLVRSALWTHHWATLRQNRAFIQLCFAILWSLSLPLSIMHVLIIIMVSLSRPSFVQSLL